MKQRSEAEDGPGFEQEPLRRLPEKIADSLMEQKHQIRAFFLSKVEDPLKEKSLEYCPEVLSQSRELNVATLHLQMPCFKNYMTLDKEENKRSFLWR